MTFPRLVRPSEAHRESLRREREGLTPRRVTPPEVIAELERAAFGIDDDAFWRKIHELDEVEWVDGISATVVTGINECPLCLREIESHDNCCGACGPFIDPGLSRWV